jgi:hypothetical protein
MGMVHSLKFHQPYLVQSLLLNIEAQQLAQVQALILWHQLDRPQLEPQH